MVSKRAIRVHIQVTGKSIANIHPAQVEIEYSARDEESTEATINFEAIDDTSAFIQAAILLDQTLVEVKRFALDSAISGVQHHGR